MTICQTLDCIHNGREEEENGTCTLNDDERKINDRATYISYKMDHPYLQIQFHETHRARARTRMEAEK